MEKLYCSEIVKVIKKSDRWNLADQEAASLRRSSFISGSSTTKPTWGAYQEKELSSQPHHCENKNIDRLCSKILILQFSVNGGIIFAKGWFGGPALTNGKCL